MGTWLSFLTFEYIPNLATDTSRFSEPPSHWEPTEWAQLLGRSPSLETSSESYTEP
jgi:hypothetical protein